MLRKALDREAFLAWMAEVDKELVRLCGISSLYLPDCAFMEWYRARVKPSRAAKRVIEYARIH